MSVRESKPRSRKVPPQLRRLVWETYMIDSKSAYGPCTVCSNEIHILSFECGHVISHANGGELTLENLRPVCGSCNKSMGKMDLWEYKERYFPSESSSVKTCKHIIVKGKRKGVICGQKVYTSDYCYTHRKDDHQYLSDNESGCQHILLRGRRKGETCGKKIHKGNYCIAHVTDNVNIYHPPEKKSFFDIIMDYFK